MGGKKGIMEEGTKHFPHLHDRKGGIIQAL